MAKRKKKRERRLHQEPVVRTVARIFETAEPTRWRFEASCRTGIRSALCLRGWRWPDADERARMIVELAAHRLGLSRPSWRQGQPAWTEDGALPIERTYCMNPGCRKPIEGQRQKFCSDVCRGAFHIRQRNAEFGRERSATRAAARATWSANQPERMCRCGLTFRPRRPGQIYCRVGCRVLGPCEQCGAPSAGRLCIRCAGEIYCEAAE